MAPVYLADGRVAERVDLGVKSLVVFVALANGNPGKFTKGPTGTGGIIHLTGALIGNMTGINIVHVPYKGGQPAANELMTGRIDMLLLSALLAERLVRAGKTQVLAVRDVARKWTKVVRSLPSLKE